MHLAEHELSEGIGDEGHVSREGADKGGAASVRADRLRAAGVARPDDGLCPLHRSLIYTRSLMWQNLVNACWLSIANWHLERKGVENSPG